MELISAEASNRHVHLSEAGAAHLFGPSGHVPKPVRGLGIGDCYASETRG